MADENTHEQEPSKDTPNEDSYEKRYKDLQSHLTKVEQENAALKETATKDKELFEAVSPYIDWDEVNGTKKAADPVDDDGYVDRRTLNQKIKSIEDRIAREKVTLDFRIKHPDMVPYEDLVGVFLQKTDARRPLDERLEKAVESTKKLLEAERIKGREDYESEKKAKEAKEAESAGLSTSKGPQGEEDPGGETYDNYIKSRKKLRSNASGE
jgi:hypothetical protein